MLALLLIPYLVLPMMGLSTALLWTLQKMRFLVISGIAAVIVDIVLGFALIPRFHAVGAAIDNDLSLLTSGIPALWLVGHLLRPSALDLRIILRAIVVAVIGGAAALVPILLLPAIPAFAVALVASMLVSWLAGTRLGILSSEDAEWLSEVLAGRMGAGSGRSSAVSGSRRGPDRPGAPAPPEREQEEEGQQSGPDDRRPPPVGGHRRGCADQDQRAVGRERGRPHVREPGAVERTSQRDPYRPRGRVDHDEARGERAAIDAAPAFGHRPQRPSEAGSVRLQPGADPS